LGGTIPVSKRIKLLNWAAKTNMWVIEDDYDSEFRYSKKPIPSLQGLDQYRKVIYLGTFSKVLFPALRIGYVVLPTVQMANVFAQAKAFSDRQNSITDQAIVHQFIEEGFFYTHLRKMRFLYKKRQEYLVSIIEKYGKDVMRVEKQNSGMHLIGWLHEKIDDQDIAAYLEKEKVTVTPLSFYYGKFKAKPGLLLGYTGFNEKKLKQGALTMIEAIRDYMALRKLAKLRNI
jgi:GntR family transcriptional regulator / MocR family aminotransferase